MFQLLIVDDERTIVDDLATTLPWEQFNIDTVHKAYSAYEALETVSRFPVDVVVTDIRMPGMTGLDLIIRIRERNHRTKVIIMSGYSDFEYALQALRSQSVDYLIKPVRDSVLMETVEKALLDLRKEWEEISSFQRAKYTLNTHMPTLRHLLLNHLLQAKPVSANHLEDQLQMLELPYRIGDTINLLLVRFDEDNLDPQSQSLHEYAVSNIADEIFSGSFPLWSCKDAYGYLVFSANASKPAEQAESPDSSAQFDRLALELQKNCSLFLKRSISMVASKQGAFPGDLITQYRSCVQTMRRESGHAKIYVAADCFNEKGRTRALREIYTLPNLSHLLEAGRWKEAMVKTELIFQELYDLHTDLSEHSAEVFWALSSALASAVHGSGRRLHEMLGEDGELMFQGIPSLSIDLMKIWFLRSVDKLRQFTESELRGSTTRIIKQAQDYIESHLGEDLSLQTIADLVHLHPSYLSKLFREETGQSFSDYIAYMRMAKAVELLRNRSYKIYDISIRLGFQYPHYFIRKFKKTYGLTPQEYRDRIP